MPGNHPFLMPRDLELKIEPELLERGNGPNPAIVGLDRINQWFDAVLKVANEKLATEQTQQRQKQVVAPGSANAHLAAAESTLPI
jgi:hypothetical protein